MLECAEAFKEQSNCSLKAFLFREKHNLSRCCGQLDLRGVILFSVSSESKAFVTLHIWLHNAIISISVMICCRNRCDSTKTLYFCLSIIKRILNYG